MMFTNSFASHFSVCRWARLTAIVAGLVIAALVPVLGLSAANAADGVSRSGVVGSVSESAVPGACLNSVYGYYVRAGGPTVSGVALTNGETAQYVRWDATLYDFTTGRAVGDSGVSAWYLASSTRPVTFSDVAIKSPGRGDTYGVFVTVQWWSPSYGGVIGNISYHVNRYYIADQYRWSGVC